MMAFFVLYWFNVSAGVPNTFGCCLLGGFVGSVCALIVAQWKRRNARTLWLYRPISFDLNLPQLEGGYLGLETIAEICRKNDAEKFVNILKALYPPVLNFYGMYHAVCTLPAWNPVGKSSRGTCMFSNETQSANVTNDPDLLTCEPREHILADVLLHVVPWIEFMVVCIFALNLVLRCFALYKDGKTEGGRGWIAVPSMDSALLSAKCVGAFSTFALIGPFWTLLSNVFKQMYVGDYELAVVYLVGAIACGCLGTMGLVVKIRQLSFIPDTKFIDLNTHKILIVAQIMLNLCNIEHDHFALFYPAGVHHLKILGDLIVKNTDNRPHVGFLLCHGVFKQASCFYGNRMCGNLPAFWRLYTMTEKEADRLVNPRLRLAHPEIGEDDGTNSAINTPTNTSRSNTMPDMAMGSTPRNARTPLLSDEERT